MSDSHKSSVDALATVFDNRMSMVDEGQGGELSPERQRMITIAGDFLNELNDLPVPPTEVAASAEQRAAAAAAPKQPVPQTNRQRDLWLNNNKRGAPTSSDGTGTDGSGSDEDFIDPAYLAECKEILEAILEKGPTFQQLKDNDEFKNAFREVHRRPFTNQEFEKMTKKKKKTGANKRVKRDSSIITKEKEKQLQLQRLKVEKMEVDMPKRGIPVDLLKFLHDSAHGNNNLGCHFWDIVNYCKELQKTVNMQKELEDRKTAAALAVEEKRLKEQRQALEQRKKERTRKV